MVMTNQLPTLTMAKIWTTALSKVSTWVSNYTAKGKHGANRDTTGLSNKFLEENPGINQQEADILAAITQAGISDNTARTHKSMQKMIQKLLPE